MRFWQKNWARGKSVQKWSPKIFFKIKRTSGVKRRDFLESIENDPHFLERVVTGEKMWVFEYGMETKWLSVRASVLFYNTLTMRWKNIEKQNLFNAQFLLVGTALASAELKLNGKNFPRVQFLLFFSKLLRNIDEFPDYLQTFWPTFQIPNFFQIFQTCTHHAHTLKF